MCGLNKGIRAELIVPCFCLLPKIIIISDTDKGHFFDPISDSLLCNKNCNDLFRKEAFCVSGRVLSGA